MDKTRGKRDDGRNALSTAMNKVETKCRQLMSEHSSIKMSVAMIAKITMYGAGGESASTWLFLRRQVLV